MLNALLFFLVLCTMNEVIASGKSSTDTTVTMTKKELEEKIKEAIAEEKKERKEEDEETRSKSWWSTFSPSKNIEKATRTVKAVGRGWCSRAEAENKMPEENVKNGCLKDENLKKYEDFAVHYYIQWCLKLNKDKDSISKKRVEERKEYCERISKIYKFNDTESLVSYLGWKILEKAGVPPPEKSTAKKTDQQKQSSKIADEDSDI